MITMNVINNQIKCIIYHDDFHLCYVWPLPSHDSFLFSPKVHFLQVLPALQLASHLRFVHCTENLTMSGS